MHRWLCASHHASTGCVLSFTASANMLIQSTTAIGSVVVLSPLTNIRRSRSRHDARNRAVCWQYTFGGDAAFNPATHHFPDVSKVLFQLLSLLCSASSVLHHQTGKRQAGFSAMTLQSQLRIYTDMARLPESCSVKPKCSSSTMEPPPME